MKMTYLFPIASLLLLIACDNQVDNQTIITSDQSKIVNPAVSERDFKVINEKHKVLLAIMDTGVDYNHEYLKNNIHFSLDEKNQPIGTGWDFTGNDAWAAPYVARTNYFNQLLTEDEKNRSQLLFDNHVELLKEFPELSSVFPIERSIDEEDIEGFDHGTHVAGLASYDSPEIGLLSYRVIPLNISESYDPIMSVLAPRNISQLFISVLLDGLEKAIKDGAQVINMSLGLNFDEKDAEKDKEIFENFKKSLTQIVENNPDVIFVVAAGNDGKWVDGTKVSILPCFIPRSNVICVSALSEDMNPATFSNIIKNYEMTTIFAWGHQILSTYPSNSCSGKDLDFSTIATSPEARKIFGEKAKEVCANKQPLKEMSGTSMASPIIARKVAKLKAECPNCNVKDIKDKLFSFSVPSSHEGMPIWKLPVEKPSWYPKTKSLLNSSWSFYFVKK